MFCMFILRLYSIMSCSHEFLTPPRSTTRPHDEERVLAGHDQWRSTQSQLALLILNRLFNCMILHLS